MTTSNAGKWPSGIQRNARTTTTNAGSRVSIMPSVTTLNVSKTTSITHASMMISNAGKLKLGSPLATGMTGNAGSRPITWKFSATKKKATTASPLSTEILALKLTKSAGGKL
jgi:hypothetical protein